MQIKGIFTEICI